MNEKQCHGFLNDYIKQFDGTIDMTDEAFNQTTDGPSILEEDGILEK